MSQQPIKWNASHCCFTAEAGKRSGSAAVGQRVTFYSLDAAQTAADPLSYISESLICQPPPANKVCLQSINLQVCLEGAHNTHKLSFHLTKWGKVTKILTHSRSVQHSHMSCGYFFVCLFLKTCNLLNYVFFLPVDLRLKFGVELWLLVSESSTLFAHHPPSPPAHDSSMA